MRIGAARTYRDLKALANQHYINTVAVGYRRNYTTITIPKPFRAYKPLSPAEVSELQRRHPGVTVERQKIYKMGDTYKYIDHLVVRAKKGTNHKKTQTNASSAVLDIFKKTLDSRLHFNPYRRV